jgi:hypothetical protein
LRGHERQNISSSHILRLLADHREEHLQVVRRRQHRVRPAPPGQAPQVLIQQRHTQSHRRLAGPAVRIDQAHIQQAHRG